MSDMDEAVDVALQGTDGAPGHITIGLNTLAISNFDSVIGTEYADTITGSDSRNVIHGGDEADTLDGGLGHDDIHGGLGNDIIDGGDGADWIYDRGADFALRNEENVEDYVRQLEATDVEGNDIIRAGAGSDILVYSGGTDVYYGGAGHDTYLANGSYSNWGGADNDLTLVMAEDAADPETFIGHDLISGNARFVDRVIFEGLNLSDVTINYSYEQFYTGSQVVEFDPLFGWFFDIEPAAVDFYSTIGTVVITVNETGSSLTIENVSGAFAGGPAQGVHVSVVPSISVPFVVEFEDGNLDWAAALVAPAQDPYSLINTPLSETAFAAREALENERSELEDPENGDDEQDDDYYGDLASNNYNGGGGNDQIRGGAGNDYLIGGAGGDAIDGGSGNDTASYVTSEFGVIVRLGDDIRRGDAEGDTLISIENVEGSNASDSIDGDSNDNILWGLGDRDWLNGEGGDDIIYGGDGDDIIEEESGDNRLYGEAGDDEITGGVGDDYLSGGDGNDVLSTTRSQIGDENGNDVFDGGAGIDTAVIGSGYGGPITVDLIAGRATLFISGEVIELIDIENVRLGSLKGSIYGNEIDNVLSGGDALYGGAGNDTLILYAAILPHPEAQAAT